MKLHPALLLLPLASALSPAFAITLAPGQSGYPDIVATADTGATLAETSYDATLFLSDAGTQEPFDSRVTRGADGSLTFWYITRDPAVPQSLTLPGFAGLTTNIQQFSSDPFDPANVILSPVFAGETSRSADGDSLAIKTDFLPIDGPGFAYTPMFILAVTTNATNFQLSNTGYQPTYYVYPYSPPGGPTQPFLSTQPRPAFIPASPAIPEPLSLTTLPLAIAALCLRRRALHP